MYYMTGTLMPGNHVKWYHGAEHHAATEIGLRIAFNIFSERCHRREALVAVQRALDKNPLVWMDVNHETWRVDLDKLKKENNDLSLFDWLTGVVIVNPEFEQENDSSSDHINYVSLACYFTPDSLRESRSLMLCPQEIRESLKEFQKEHPDPRKAIFVMMPFDKSERYEQIIRSIQTIFAEYGVSALRADSKRYHNIVLYNILTYISGSGSGVAVFERLKNDIFNANVSFELGYMMALGKRVCLLKDNTLVNLHSDLGGLMYEEFDPDCIDKTIPSALSKWALNSGIIHEPQSE